MPNNQLPSDLPEPTFEPPAREDVMAGLQVDIDQAAKAAPSVWTISARERMVRDAAKHPVGADLPDWRFAHVDVSAVSDRQVTRFTRDLSDLLDAHIPLLRSLTILEEKERPSRFKNILSAVRKSVESGEPLSSAIARHPEAFDLIYCNMIAAGESASVLDLILRRMAEFRNKAARLRDRLVGASLYPGVILAMMFVTFMALTVFVVPKFEKIFDDMGTELPMMTKMVMNLSRWSAGNLTPDQMVPGWLIMTSIPILAYLGFKLIRATRIGRILLEQLGLIIPVFGDLIYRSNMAQISRTIGTLLNAGVPLNRALEIARDTTAHHSFKSMLSQAVTTHCKGEPFTDALRKSDACDAILLDLLEVGDETGSLPTVLLRVAADYEEQVDRIVVQLISFIEPAAAIGIAATTGFVILSLFLPFHCGITNLT